MVKEIAGRDDEGVTTVRRDCKPVVAGKKTTPHARFMVMAKTISDPLHAPADYASRVLVTTEGKQEVELAAEAVARLCRTGSCGRDTTADASVRHNASAYFGSMEEVLVGVSEVYRSLGGGDMDSG